VFSRPTTLLPRFGRIDLGIGRAPGTDQLAMAALRRRMEGAEVDDFVERLFGRSLNDALGWQRNNFDRVIHFAYGLLLAYPMREVFLRIEPLARGEGFDYVNAVVGGAIPGQFIPAIEKGVRQALEEGSLAGFPLHDVRVTVYDGKFHSVDSKEIAFVTAGKKAFLEAVENAGPVVLEPMVNISITTPDSFMGDLTGDLSSRRGQITGTETGRNGMLIIKGQAPLAELENYGTQLKAITGGEGSYAIEFSHYEAVPGNIQKQLIEKYQASVH